MTRSSLDEARKRGVRDEISRVHLLRGAGDVAALHHKLTMIGIEAAQLLALHRSHFNPDQPRVPAGHPDGGQWTSEGEGLEQISERPSRARDRLILSDATPDGIKVWTQYAEAKGGDEIQNKAADADADAALIGRTTAMLHNVVLQVAGLVIRRPGSSPREFGTDVHFAFAKAVRALNLPGIGTVGVEQSFDKEGLANYGSDGSIRTDVVLRNPRGDIIAIYDLKTGDAIIRPPRSAELRTMTDAGPDVPVIELHAVRGIRYR
jgi:hypothetical protein